MAIGESTCAGRAFGSGFFAFSQGPFDRAQPVRYVLLCRGHRSHLLLRIVENLDDIHKGGDN